MSSVLEIAKKLNRAYKNEKLALTADFDKVLDIGILAAAEKAKENKSAESEQSAVSEELLAYINERIEARKQAKANKDFALADSIRAELLEKGIVIKDTREGTTFTLS